MRRIGVAVLGVLILLGGRPAVAGSGFDHYLLALTWTPAWCHFQGVERRDARCAPGMGIGWRVHGLWPQHARGWPEDCTTAARDPTRSQTAAMVDIMGSAGLAWHQWRKHGRCSGLNAAAYFALTREAYSRVTLPPLSGSRITVEELSAAIRAATPGLEPEALVVMCRDGLLTEVRICLQPWLASRACGADVRARACSGAVGVVAPP